MMDTTQNAKRKIEIDKSRHPGIQEKVQRSRIDQQLSQWSHIFGYVHVKNSPFLPKIELFFIIFNTIYFRSAHWRRRICSYQTSIQSKDSWLCYGWRATSSKRISHSSSGIKHSGRCQSFWVVWTTNNVSLYTLELNLEHCNFIRI